MRRASLLLAACLLVAGCGSTATTTSNRPAAKRSSSGKRAGGIPRSLLAEMRPIGRGPRFQPPVRGSVTGACTSPLGPRLEAHVEIFGANRVVLLAAGIGTRPPRRLSDGRVVRAGCFGNVVTLDPTGTVYFRSGRRLTVGNLFRAWGQPLTDTRIASFDGGRVSVYVDGRRRDGSPAAVPLTQHAEIVLEVGPHVPPHTRFTFPPSPSPRLS